MKNKLKVGCLEDCTEYSVCQDCPFGKDCEFEDEYDDGCEDCPCFNNGFDMGFRQGSKIAREELMDDIYIDGYRILHSFYLGRTLQNELMSFWTWADLLRKIRFYKWINMNTKKRQTHFGIWSVTLILMNTPN